MFAEDQGNRERRADNAENSAPSWVVAPSRQRCDCVARNFRRLMAQLDPAGELVRTGAGGCGHSAVVPFAY